MTMRSRSAATANREDFAKRDITVIVAGCGYWLARSGTGCWRSLVAGRWSLVADLECWSNGQVKTQPAHHLLEESAGTVQRVVPAGVREGHELHRAVRVRDLRDDRQVFNQRGADPQVESPRTDRRIHSQAKTRRDCRRRA